MLARLGSSTPSCVSWPPPLVGGAAASKSPRCALGLLIKHAYADSPVPVARCLPSFAISEEQHHAMLVRLQVGGWGGGRGRAGQDLVPQLAS